MSGPRRFASAMRRTGDLGGGVILAALASLALAACQRETREYQSTPAAETAPRSVAVSTLQPGGGPLAPPDPRGQHYDGNAYDISQGEQLFRWMNCGGCHAHGGGGMGPALIDATWRYGGSIEQIYASIAHGRPNGMPAWQGRLTETQIWQLAAYIRSISGNTPKAAAGSRSEEMANIPPPDIAKPQPTQGEPSGGPS